MLRPACIDGRGFRDRHASRSMRQKDEDKSNEQCAPRAGLVKGNIKLSKCTDREENCNDRHAFPLALTEPGRRIAIKAVDSSHVFSPKSRPKR
jgi:hypothetical protein